MERSYNNRTINLEMGAISKPSSLSTIVYMKLKEMILTLRIEPSQSIILEHLAELLEVSRTPVRDAIMKLEMDGFVETAGQRGKRVTPITPEYVQELFSVRKPLESIATQLGTVNISDAMVKELEKDLAKTQAHLENAQYDHYFEMDSRLHQVIVDAARNRWLKRFLQPINEHVYRIRWFAKSFGGNLLQESHIEHIRILEAIKTRNPELAKEAMERHIESAGDRISRLVDHGLEVHQEYAG